MSDFTATVSGIIANDFVSGGLTFSLQIDGIPELMVMNRQALANLLREEAASESHPYTAARLREIAAVFETGQPHDLKDD
jgi:hypothetical protein